MEKGVSFTFETVMSSPDKVALLQKAQSLGYRTYLYYVATEKPRINIERVRSRVLQGGHPVPEDKIIARYPRSLELLLPAIQASNRAFIFDNSGTQHRWLAEVTNGEKIQLQTSDIPTWFQTAVLDKIGV